MEEETKTDLELPKELTNQTDLRNFILMSLIFAISYDAVKRWLWK